MIPAELRIIDLLDSIHCDMPVEDLHILTESSQGDPILLYQFDISGSYDNVPDDALNLTVISWRVSAYVYNPAGITSYDLYVYI